MPRKRYLTGLAEAQRTFRRMPAEFHEKLVDALNRGAEETAERQRILAPSEFGDLRESIRAERVGEGPAPVEGRIVARAIVTDFKARWIEFGTRPHSLRRNASIARGLRQDGGRQHPGSRARPFFFAGYASVRRRVRNRIRRNFRAAVKAVVKGAARAR